MVYTNAYTVQEAGKAAETKAGKPFRLGLDSLLTKELKDREQLKDVSENMP